MPKIILLEETLQEIKQEYAQQGKAPDAAQMHREASERVAGKLATQSPEALERIVQEEYARIIDEKHHWIAGKTHLVQTGDILDRGPDSKKVMDLLNGLHQAGSTICMVTHDPRYAHMAERMIHLFDGQIVSEEDAKKMAELEESGFDVA